ncbi:MAG: TlpA disulfide reductase family protein [Desulfomonilaceae bacterium]|jgi:peroxiredoxin
MQKRNLYFALAVILMLFAPVPAESSQELTINADTLKNIKFDAPENLVDKKYLGLPDGKTFHLGQVRSNYLIIELFSMYCPVCQRSAGTVNQVYDLIHNTQGVRDNFKVIGIGVGNTPYEVSVFKKKFQVGFPLIADDNFVIQKALSNDIRTPTFIVAKLSGKGQLGIVFTWVGEIKDAGEFIRKLENTLGSH